MISLFWVLYGYCVMERLGELVVSRRNQARMVSRGFSEKESPGGLWLMIAMHTGWYVSMAYEAMVAPKPIPATLAVIAGMLFLCAQVLRFWALRTLGSFWNISVMTSDRAAPEFVSDGPYRFIRHPNYLVVIVELASLPLIGGAAWTALGFSILNACVLWRRIPLEESHLLRLPGYREVMGMKGRFFPRTISSGR
jgi:methyltransferase